MSNDSHLSGDCVRLIKMGLKYREAVVDYSNLPGCGDQIEMVYGLFKIQYELLKQEKLSSDVIFVEMQKWVGGHHIKSTEHQVATLAILACFLRRCGFVKFHTAEKHITPEEEG